MKRASHGNAGRRTANLNNEVAEPGRGQGADTGWGLLGGGRSLQLNPKDAPRKKALEELRPSA